MEKIKFNVWRFEPELSNITGGWRYFVTITTTSEEKAKATVSREYNIPLYAVKAYPHIEPMEAVA